MSAKVEITATKMEKILEEKCVYEWTIKDFRSMIIPIRTPVFTAMENANAKFYFEVWFQKIHPDRNCETSSLQVVLRKLPEYSVSSKLQFQLLVSVYFSNGELYTEYKSNKAISLDDFTSKTCINVCAIYNETLGQILRKDTLVLKCCMTSNGHLLLPKSYYNETHALHDLRKFTKNFEALYQSDELSDVSVQVGDKIFKSHKFVLASQSPVFKRMLMQDFQESKTGIITISDIDPDVFESFLKYLYSGEVGSKSFSDFKQLYCLSDKYDIQTLKQECASMLTDINITEDQIDDVFQLAYLYNDDNLKKAAKYLVAFDYYKKGIVM